MVFADFVIDASNPDAALEKLRDRIIKLCDEDERYYKVHDFFLDSFVEIDKVGEEAKEISWVSMMPFGDSFAQLRYLMDGDSSLRNYILENDRSPLPNTSGRDSSSSLQLAPFDEATDENDEAVPFLSLDRDRYQFQPLYRELSKRKFQNILPDFDKLSDGDLYELYVVEGCTSNEISALFDAKKSKVDYRRRKIGATFDENVLYSMLKRLDVIDPIPYKGFDGQNGE